MITIIKSVVFLVVLSLTSTRYSEQSFDVVVKFFSEVVIPLSSFSKWGLFFFERSIFATNLWPFLCRRFFVCCSDILKISTDFYRHKGLFVSNDSFVLIKQIIGYLFGSTIPVLNIVQLTYFFFNSIKSEKSIKNSV